MANRKISALTAILSGDISTADDYLPIVDASVVDADKNKRVTVAELGEAILAAGLTSNFALTGNTTLTGNLSMIVDNQFAFEVLRTGGDRLNIGPLAAGSGVQIVSFNAAANDFEPMEIEAEDIQLWARTGVGTNRQVVKVSDSGVTQYNSTGDRWHTWGHNTDGVHWTLSNNGDDFRWINAGAAIAMMLSAGGELTVGRAASAANPLRLVAADTVGDCYMSFYESNVVTRKGYIGYGSSGDDTLYFENEENNANNFYATNGSGAHRFATNGAEQFRVAHTANSVNYLQVTGASTGNTPVLSAAGSDADVNLIVTSKAGGGISLMTNSGANPALYIAHTANSVNYLTIGGNATGAGPFLQANGSDTDVDLRFFTKGAANFVFWTDSGLAQQLVITHTASAVNYLQVGGVATGGGPYVQANGSDTNIDLRFFSKGSGNLRFYTNHGTNGEQVRIVHTVNAANYLEMTGAPAGSGPYIFANGSDTNIDLKLFSKGSGSVRFLTNGDTEQARVTHTASAVNYLEMSGAVTGGAGPWIQASGSDTDIDLRILPKGTGLVRFGTHTGSGDVAISGYITIKDAAGNTRKLAVIT